MSDDLRPDYPKSKEYRESLSCTHFPPLEEVDRRVYTIADDKIPYDKGYPDPPPVRKSEGLGVPVKSLYSIRATSNSNTPWMVTEKGFLGFSKQVGPMLTTIEKCKIFIKNLELIDNMK